MNDQQFLDHCILNHRRNSELFNCISIKNKYYWWPKLPDGIIGLNDGIGVANSAAIGGIQVGDILGSSLDLTDTAQFVLGLLVGDPKK